MPGQTIKTQESANGGRKFQYGTTNVGQEVGDDSMVSWGKSLDTIESKDLN